MVDLNSVDMNNVVVHYRDHTISIAYHKVNDRTTDMNVAVWGPSIDDDMKVFYYGYDVDMLIDALTYAKNYVDVALGFDDYDGQPDEAQEWHDFDPDC